MNKKPPKINKATNKTPPFIITSKIINLIAKISEQVGSLNASLLNSSPYLRKQNRIKTIAETLEKNTQKNAPINAPINASINPTKTPDAVLMLIKDNPKILVSKSPILYKKTCELLAGQSLHYNKWEN